MALGILVTKVGMTQLFLEGGIRVPVTVLRVQPNTVVAKRQAKQDGYSALQLGSGTIRPKLVRKPRAGQFAKAGIEPTRYLREFRVSQEQVDAYEVGSCIGLELFEEGQSVDIAGTSKGKGFAGVMKRHGFAGFPATHGTHESFRGGGSIGQREQPGKVFKGKKMAGHMGSERVSVLNLRLIRVMKEEGALCVMGAVPGSKGDVVEVRLSDRSPRMLAGLGDTVQTKSKNPMKASKAGGTKKPAAKKK